MHRSHMETPSTSHILVVDDDPKVRKLLRRCFEPEGYRVSEAADHEQALHHVRGGDVDLITLDLHLGAREDGFAVARAVRAVSRVPIVMVTGKGDVIDRVVGLELGADDYVTKPFHLRELLARVRSVLRRSAPVQDTGSVTATTGEDVVRFGPWTADFASLQVRDESGRSAGLTASETRLLEIFARRPQRVLNRDQIMDLAKGQDWNSNDRAIDNQVARLRKKIEQDPKAPRFLKTVRGEGYVFVPAG